MSGNSEIVNFFKKHNLYDEEAFQYIDEHLIKVDYNDEELRNFWGCFASRQKGLLTNITLVLPIGGNNIESNKIWVREITKALVYYRHLNRRYGNEYKEEAIPSLYEKIYVLEKLDTKLLKEYNDSEKVIEKGQDNKYSFALYARERLFKRYTDNLDVLENTTKNAYRDYKRILKNK